MAGLIGARPAGCARRRASRAGASGLLILNALAFAGDPLEPAADPFDPQAHYTDGLNLFALAAADPVNRTDPLGLFLGLDLVLGAGTRSELEAQRAQAAGGALALLLAVLGSQATQFGVAGGYSSTGFDLFLDGIDAFIAGSFSAAESLLSVAEVDTLAAYAASQSEAVRRALSFWPVLSAHFAKLATGGPNDPRNNSVAREIKAWLSKIAKLVEKHMKGKTRRRWLEWLRHANETLERVLRGGGDSLPPMPG